MNLFIQKKQVLAMKTAFIGFLSFIFLVLAKELSRLAAIKLEYSFFCFCAIYLSFCFQKLAGTEKGVREFLGIPYACVDSGLRFVFFPIEKIIKYPKEIQSVEAPEQIVLTTSGNESDDEYCSSASVGVNGILYFSWPDGDDLVTAYRAAPKPNQPEEVKKIFESVLVNGIRTAASKMTWRACSQPIFQEKIADELKHPEGAIAKAKITNFRVEITSIELPEELEDAISQPQIAELRKTAEIKKGEADMRKRELAGLGDAAARKAVFEAIAAQGDAGLAYEMLLTLRKMAKGKSATMFYSLPSEISGILNKALGGKSGSGTEEIIDALGGKEGIQELIKKIKKLTA